MFCNFKKEKSILPLTIYYRVDLQSPKIPKTKDASEEPKILSSSEFTQCIPTLDITRSVITAKIILSQSISGKAPQKLVMLKY